MPAQLNVTVTVNRLGDKQTFFPSSRRRDDAAARYPAGCRILTAEGDALAQRQVRIANRRFIST